MPFLNVLRPREPSHPPALWLVPRWWAFSRDDRYRVHLVNDRDSVGSHSNRRPTYPQPRDRSLRRVISNQNTDRSERQHTMPWVVREQSSALNQTPAKTHTCTKGVVPEESAFRETSPIEPSQALIPTPKAVTYGQYHSPGDQYYTQSRYTHQIDHKSYPPKYEQVKDLPLRHKKGQTQRRVEPTLNLSKSPQLLEHKPNCPVVIPNNSKSILKSKPPTEAMYAHLADTTRQHRQPPSSSSDLKHHFDDAIVRGMDEQQKNLTQDLLVSQRHCHHNTWSKHMSPVSEPCTEKEQLVPDCLMEPDTMKGYTLHHSPSAHMSTNDSTYVHLSPSTSYQVPDHGYEEIDCDTQSSIEAPRFPLDTISLIRPLELPLHRQMLAYDPAYEFSFHTSPHPYVHHNLHRLPAHREQLGCPHHLKEDALQHDCGHHHARNKLSLSQSSNHHSSHQGRTKIPQNQKQHPENRNYYPSHGYSTLHPPSNTLPGCQSYEDHLGHVCHQNQGSDPGHDHQHYHGDDDLPPLYSPYQPNRCHETVDQPYFHGQDRCGQIDCSDCGANHGRRLSYIRTRGQQLNTGV